MSPKKPLKKLGRTSTQEKMFFDPAKLLILFLLFGQTFYFFVSWIQIFWLNKPINMILTNLASDPPWMPNGQVSSPIIGVHHFGDWALLRGWILSGDPYHQLLPAYPPISLLLAEPFTWFSNNVGFFLYMLTTVAVIISALYRILRCFDLYLRIQLTMLLGLFNTPMLLIFDRGNNIGLMFGILAWGLIFLQENRPMLSVICLGVGAGMKLYPILIFIPLYFWGFRKTALRGFSLTVALNLLLFTRYPKGILENIKIFYSEVLMGGNTSGIGVSPEFVMNQIGPFSTQLALICQRADQSAALSYFIDLPNFVKYAPILVWIINLCFIPLHNSDFAKLRFSLLLLTLQFLPLMPPYISVWSTIGAAILLTIQNDKVGVKDGLNKCLVYSILIMVVIILIPLPFTFGDQACGTTLNKFLGTIYFLYFNILLALTNIRSRINSKTAQKF